MAAATISDLRLTIKFPISRSSLATLRRERSVPIGGRAPRLSFQKNYLLKLDTASPCLVPLVRDLSGNATYQELPSLRSGEFAFRVAPADVGNLPTNPESIDYTGCQAEAK